MQKSYFTKVIISPLAITELMWWIENLRIRNEQKWNSQNHNKWYITKWFRKRQEWQYKKHIVNFNTPSKEEQDCNILSHENERFPHQTSFRYQEDNWDVSCGQSDHDWYRIPPAWMWKQIVSQGMCRQGQNGNYYQKS